MPIRVYWVSKKERYHLWMSLNVSHGNPPSHEYKLLGIKRQGPNIKNLTIPIAEQITAVAYLIQKK